MVSPIDLGRCGMKEVRMGPGIDILISMSHQMKSLRKTVIRLSMSIHQDPPLNAQKVMHP